MANVRQQLWEILQYLKEDEFQNFKWFLQDDKVEGFTGITVAQLEKAERCRTVDLMVQKYHSDGALKVTMTVLGQISRNDLVKRLQDFSDFGKKKAELGAKFKQMIQERQKKIREIKDSSELSSKSADRQIADSKQAFSELQRTLQESLENLLKSINEKRDTVKKQAEKFVRELEREIAELTRKIAEVERPSLREDQTALNSTPPVKSWTNVSVAPPSYGGSLAIALPQLEEKLREHKEKFIAKGKLNRVQQFVKDVTLDPDTAHPSLILSDDGKKVHYGDGKRTLPDNPRRFICTVNVLGKQSFSSGRFYFQVQVKDKTSWDLGVVKESIERKQSVTASPDNGFWTICLRDGQNYQASGVHLNVKSKLKTVGVFVDFEKRSVSFFDVDSAEIIHSFTNCSFAEKIYPFLSPGLGGTNSAPLVISPVSYIKFQSI